MILLFLTFTLEIVGSKAMGEFVVLHSPESLQFSGTSTALLSSVKEIFAGSLGLSVNKTTDWNSLFVLDPFATPEAVVEIYIDGISHLGFTIPKSKSFRLIVDGYASDTYDALKRCINRNVYNGNGSNIVCINLNNGAEISDYSSVFGYIDIELLNNPQGQFEYLSASVHEDKEFLVELEVLKAIIEKVNAGAIKSDDRVDFYEFRCMTLKSLCDYYGPNSSQTREAKFLLANAVEALNRAFVIAYQDNVLVTIVTVDFTGPLTSSRRKAVQREIMIKT